MIKRSIAVDTLTLALLVLVAVWFLTGCAATRKTARIVRNANYSLFPCSVPDAVGKDGVTHGSCFEAHATVTFDAR